MADVGQVSGPVDLDMPVHMGEFDGFGRHFSVISVSPGSSPGPMQPL
jgi:hypothetical protein